MNAFSDIHPNFAPVVMGGGGHLPPSLIHNGPPPGGGGEKLTNFKTSCPHPVQIGQKNKNLFYRCNIYIYIASVSFLINLNVCISCFLENPIIMKVTRHRVGFV